MYSYLANSWVKAHKKRKKEEKQEKLSEAPGGLPGEGVGGAGIAFRGFAGAAPPWPGAVGRWGGERDLRVGTPTPASGGPTPATLIQPQDVTAVGSGGRADHEFSHFVFCFSSLCGPGPCTWTVGGGWFASLGLPGRHCFPGQDDGTMTWRTSANDVNQAALY